jgi:hypothetical protein
VPHRPEAEDADARVAAGPEGEAEDHVATTAAGREDPEPAGPDQVAAVADSCITDLQQGVGCAAGPEGDGVPLLADSGLADPVPAGAERPGFLGTGELAGSRIAAPASAVTVMMHLGTRAGRFMVTPLTEHGQD